MAKPAKLRKMAKFAINLFGYPYDRDEIVRIAASKLGFKKGEIKRDKEYICPEYAWEYYSKVGVKVPYNTGGFVAPSDFARDKNISVVARIR